MPRRYTQRVRAEGAQRTRAQVLDAARAALLADGRLEFSVAEISSTAGVARSTVYTTFGSRDGLLGALVDEVLHGAGLDRVITEYRRPDAVEALERSLLASCRMYAADQRLFARLVALREVDPAAAEPLARSEADRALGMGHLAGRLAEQGRLRDGLSVAAAADILWLLTSFRTFDELSSGRGLATERCAEVLVGIARASVVDPDRASDR